MIPCLNDQLSQKLEGEKERKPETQGLRNRIETNLIIPMARV
jgi:hypothetical protein